MERIISKHTIFISAVIIIAIVITSCTTVPVNDISNKKRVRSHVDVGLAYLQSGQYTSAIREFAKAEKLAPKDPDLHYYLGISYNNIKRYNRAVTELKKAIVLKPDSPSVHNYLGTVYIKTGFYDKAITEFQIAASDDLYETPAIALNNMGWVYYRKGDYKTALLKYQEALDRNPSTNIPFLIQKNMGVAYLADNQINNAIRHLKKSLQIAPYIAETHYWLGMSYLKKKEYGKAVEELRSAVEIDPESEFGQKAQKRLDAPN
jgi:type IV pilus biogenesis/stability protein PilW